MAQGGMSLPEQFVNFSKFGESESDGTTITLTQLDKWFRQANLIGPPTGGVFRHNPTKNCYTTTETGVSFNKFKRYSIDYETFLEYLDDLTDQHRHVLPLRDLQEMLENCGLPGTNKPGTATVNPKSRSIDHWALIRKYKGGKDDLGPEVGTVVVAPSSTNAEKDEQPSEYKMEF